MQIQSTLIQNLSSSKLSTQTQPKPVEQNPTPPAADDKVTFSNNDGGFSLGRAALGTAVGVGVGALAYAGVMSGGVLAHVAGAGALGVAGAALGGSVGIGLDLMNMFSGSNKNYSGKLAGTGAVIGAVTGAVMGMASGNPLVAAAGGLAAGGATGLTTYALSGIGNLYNK